MNLCNKCAKKPQDQLRWLQVIQWSLSVIGCLALLHTMIYDVRPVPTPVVFDFTSVMLWIAGIVAILIAWTAGMIRERILKRREIGELNAKIQELEDKLAQK